eukprot:Colp12_sorted_trinity150504_noHs@34055
MRNSVGGNSRINTVRVIQIAGVLGVIYAIFVLASLSSKKPYVEQPITTSVIAAKDTKISSLIAQTRFERRPRHYKYMLHQKFGCKGYCIWPIEYTFAKMGYNKTEDTSDPDWDFWWGHPENFDTFYENLKPYQTVSNWPNMWAEIEKKDEVCRKAAAHPEIAANGIPECFVYPENKEVIKKNFDGVNEWIVKPVSGPGGGHGIQKIQKYDELPQDDGESVFVVQRYISDPFLIDGRKFDLRTYAVVTSWEPLRLYFHQYGSAKIASVKFQKGNFDNKCMHITNYDTQKDCPGFSEKHDYNPFKGKRGNLWSMAQFREYVAEQGYDDVAMWKGLEDSVVRMFMLAEANMRAHVKAHVPHRNNAFQLYGVDVMFDSSLKPWILEVNQMPSMIIADAMGWWGFLGKTTLLRNVFELVGIDPFKSFYMGHRAEIEDRITRFCKANSCSDEDVKVLTDTEDEMFRRGEFNRVFPPLDKNTVYYSYFPESTHNNELLRKYTDFEEPLPWWFMRYDPIHNAFPVIV